MKCNARNVRIIGLMSGTSHDGVDVALVEINEALDQVSCHPELGSGSQNQEILKQVQNDNLRVVRLLHHLHLPYRKPLRDEIRQAFNGSTELICRLNFKLGEVFAGAVLSLLKAAGFRPEDIDAIASHGQTLYHIPPASLPPFSKGGRGGLRAVTKTGSTLQIGEAAVIAERTGILTISDFRTADMAAGGQGAPLVPLADYLLFRKPGQVRAVLNIGGIANVTIVREKMEDTIAFDIGPGNSLIDEAMKLYSEGKRSYDRNGSFARSGKPIKRLLDKLLSHPYFRKDPPKSTGRETFGAQMVKKGTDLFSGTVPENKSVPSPRPHDIVATLTYLTAITIHNAIIQFKPDEVILTGGGVHNKFLVELIHSMFKNEGVAINEISLYGIPPQAKEAVSFAILGYQTLNHRPGNIPSVTGARHNVVLGKVTLPQASGN
ncbi:MAG: anhydro-N-acetylmuramic acid kinase [Nitrospirae bacterium]|nr:anhydro-N-acetylmuramic acid kinase [Nitrospirota bacterium]